MNYTFQFSSAGTVASYDEIRSNGKREREKLDRDERGYRDGNLIVIEEHDDGVIEWDIFQDADGDGLWQKVASGETPGLLDSAKKALAAAPQQALGFKLVAGAEDTVFVFDATGRATHVGEIERNGKIDFDKVEKDESFQLSGAFVLGQEFGKRGAAEEWTLYHDADQDGRWAEVAEGYGAVDLVGLIAQVTGSGLLLA